MGAGGTAGSGGMPASGGTMPQGSPYADDFVPRSPPSTMPFGERMQLLQQLGGGAPSALGSSLGAWQQQQAQPYAGLTNTAALWGPQSAGYQAPQAPTNQGYLQGMAQQGMSQQRTPDYSGLNPQTLSGLGNFNPGGLGGPQMNSPYWQPQGMAQQQPFANPSQTMAGPAQQGYLMPAFAQPWATQGGNMRKFMRSGVPYGLLSNPATAGMASGPLGAMTRGQTMPTMPPQTGYVPVVGGKVGRYF